MPNPCSPTAAGALAGLWFQLSAAWRGVEA